MYHGSMMESIGSYILIIIAIISIWRHLGYGDTSSQFHVLCDPGFWIVSQAVASFELTSNQHWFFDDEIFEMYLSRVQIIRRWTPLVWDLNMDTTYLFQFSLESEKQPPAVSPRFARFDWTKKSGYSTFMMLLSVAFTFLGQWMLIPRVVRLIPRVVRLIPRVGKVDSQGW